jgi:hypothetical protein
MAFRGCQRDGEAIISFFRVVGLLRSCRSLGFSPGDKTYDLCLSEVQRRRIATSSKKLTVSKSETIWLALSFSACARPVHI